MSNSHTYLCSTWHFNDNTITTYFLLSFKGMHTNSCFQFPVLVCMVHPLISQYWNCKFFVSFNEPIPFKELPFKLTKTWRYWLWKQYYFLSVFYLTSLWNAINFIITVLQNNQFRVFHETFTVTAKVIKVTIDQLSFTKPFNIQVVGQTSSKCDPTPINEAV